MLPLALLAACDTHDNDYISKYCPGSCTVIKGRVSDANGAPVAGAALRIKWRDSGYLQPKYTRDKAMTRTDANGNYELRFLLRDDEFAEGYFELITDFKDEGYLSCNEDNIWSAGYNLARDSTILQNFTVAPAAALRLTVDAEEAPQRYARLISTITYKLAASDPDSCMHLYDSQHWGFYGYSVAVPAGQPVIVRTEKTLADGSRSSQKDTLVLQPGEQLEYSLDL
ncbi:carboxypeptidase regulatory-like domain-containing protein [Pontibacter mangrovi]|uniref:Carboxypeptidase regulatory-like domain-containing protein n=2 Tax=Pontibacter mangrovi TaxID=2589816 RepID=A0A501W7E4_9BACT|nr:carboxypeptidase regulatory-like domain-containing protein [Pontibacter mangrovi]